MKNMRTMLFLVFATGFAVASYAGSSGMTPEAVTAQIESKGPQSAREAYFSCENGSKAMGYKLVEQGGDAWLRIAARLVKDSDGCYTVGLQSAIALALIHNPEGVLDLIGTDNKLGADYICIPFMTDEDDPAKLKGQLKTLDRIENALKMVKAQRLQARKNKCLGLVRSLQQDIKAQQKNR